VPTRAARLWSIRRDPAFTLRVARGAPAGSHRVPTKQGVGRRVPANGRGGWSKRHLARTPADGDHGRAQEPQSWRSAPIASRRRYIRRLILTCCQARWLGARRVADAALRAPAKPMVWFARIRSAPLSRGLRSCHRRAPPSATDHPEWSGCTSDKPEHPVSMQTRTSLSEDMQPT
jgi:hypothetical protein